MRFLLAVLISLGVCWGQKAHDHHDPSEHKGRSAEEWVSILESEERVRWQMPEEVVAALGIKPGQSVADLGAGSGYFSVRFVEAVGPQGNVYAVDIDQGLIDHLTRRAHHAGLSNLKAVLTSPEEPGLSAGSTDLVFICNVYHHIGDRVAYLSKLRRGLRPGGRVAIVDFYKREAPFGPPVEHKLAKANVLEEFEAAGYALGREHDFLPHQYFLVFEPK